MYTDKRIESKTSLRDSGGHSARDRFVQYRHRVGNGMPSRRINRREDGNDPARRQILKADAISSAQ